ncbi:MAG: ribonuclease R [Bacteroidales bacterium]|jgi:ribonuclease R
MPKNKSDINKPLESLQKDVFGVFVQSFKKTLNYKQVCKRLGKNDKSFRQLIINTLSELSKKGYLVQEYQGKFKINPKELEKIKKQSAYITGIVDMTSSGRAFIISEQSEEDIKVAASNLKTALNGDTVKIFLYPKKKDKQPEGEVIEIISRTKTEFVGTLKISERFAFFVSDNNIGTDIFVPLNSLKDAKNGQKVVVKITDWAENSKCPFGEVIEVLGNPGETSTEINSIIVDYNFPLKFPEKVTEEANKISVIISEPEIKKRRDFRNITTFTIDPIDAKDFDDAISFKKLNNGNCEVGVHIADVTHYIKQDTILDKEALHRATSVYLVDRVIPMLPENLSNNICSLRPNEDKLCFSAVFELNDDAEIKNEWFGKTIINSNRRFNYDEVQEILEKKKGDFADELSVVNELAKKLRKKRISRGSFEFDRAEVKFELDEKLKPVGVFLKQQKESNMLIEDFMLLANKKVAELAGMKKENKQTKPFVYRIHDEPDPEKLIELARFVGKLGYKIKTNSTKNISESMNEMLENVKGKNEQSMIENLAIRTMAKAHYSTINVGHYGLAFRFYTHFTSPIRRYPDVLVHRLLEKYLNNEPAENIEKLEEMCKHSSKMEMQAAEAERESIKFMQVLYLSDKIGKVFDGIISGVTKWGIYVELINNHCEGMIKLKDINDDFYYLDEENYMIIGRRNRNVYKLGDKVKIKVANADLTKKQLDFVLVEED